MIPYTLSTPLDPICFHMRPLSCMTLCSGLRSPEQPTLSLLEALRSIGYLDPCLSLVSKIWFDL